MRNRKLSIYKLAALGLLIISFVVCIMLKILDILPAKYYLPVVIGILIINIIDYLFLFRKRVKKYKKNIALVISILLIILSFYPIIYMSKTMNFMDSIIATDYKLENYSVVVLKSSDYKKIKDLDGIPLGIYENTDGIKRAKKELLKSVDVTFESYDNLENISRDLLDNKVACIVLEDSILSMIKEDIPDFEEKIKVIYTFNIKIKSDNEAKDVKVDSEPFNIYMTGIDTYGDISSVSRSDVNIVMTVNPKTKQVLLTSIPRDYYVELHGKKGSRDKLTHAGIYGTDMSIGTIEDLLGVEINYYFKVNFSSFVDIINALGGIEVYSKYAFTSIDGYKYSEGYNEMNGEEALSFARERKAFSEGDRQRGIDQQAVIEAVIKKLSNKSVLSKYDSLLKSIEGKFQTNMSSKKITSLIKMQLDDMATWNVVSISLDGSNGRGITYSGGNQELYVMIPNWDTVDEASSTIKAVLDGKKLDESFKPDKTTSTRVMKSFSGTETKKEVKKEEVVEQKEEKKEEVIEKKEEVIDDKIDDSNEKKIEIKIENEEPKKEEVKENNESLNNDKENVSDNDETNKDISDKKEDNSDSNTNLDNNDNNNNDNNNNNNNNNSNSNSNSNTEVTNGSSESNSDET